MIRKHISSSSFERRRHWFVIVGGVVAVVVVYFIDPRVNTLIPCYFHLLTGYDCAGCGMTRATHCLLHGNFNEALDYNIFSLIILPLVGYSYGRFILQHLFAISIPPLPTNRVAIIITSIVLIAYTIIRNI